MKRFTYITLILILGLMTLTLTAGTYTHTKGGLSIWFPDDWKIETEGEQLEATSPNEEAFAHIMVLEDAENLEDAVEAYTDELDGIVKNFKVTTEAESVKFNGLEFYILEGEGTVEGALLDVGVALILTPKTVVMMVTVNSKEAAEVYDAEFKKIVQSIKAI